MRPSTTSPAVTDELGSGITTQHRSIKEKRAGLSALVPQGDTSCPNLLTYTVLTSASSTADEAVPVGKKRKLKATSGGSWIFFQSGWGRACGEVRGDATRLRNFEDRPGGKAAIDKLLARNITKSGDQG